MLLWSELRIGSWIMDAAPHDDIFQAEWKHIAMLALGERKYRGVELSTKWLKKFKFVEEKTNDIDECELWSIQVSNVTSLYYQPNSGGNDWYLSHEWNNNHFKNDFWGSPKYIHQLQNLYLSLTGEELTIKND